MTCGDEDGVAGVAGGDIIDGDIRGDIGVRGGDAECCGIETSVDGDIGKD